MNEEANTSAQSRSPAWLDVSSDAASTKPESELCLQAVQGDQGLRWLPCGQVFGEASQ
jgi:hypothetical protein